MILNIPWRICYKQVKSGYGSQYIIVLDLRKIIGGAFFRNSVNSLNIRECEKDGSRNCWF